MPKAVNRISEAVGGGIVGIVAMAYFGILAGSFAGLAVASYNAFARLFQ